MADTASVLELRPGYGNGMVTALVRVEGHPVGVIANNNAHLGGSIESFGSDKAARFAKMCDSWNIPILTLVDTPGMMIGPEAEDRAGPPHQQPDRYAGHRAVHWPGPRRSSAG